MKRSTVLTLLLLLGVPVFSNLQLSLKLNENGLKRVYNMGHELP
jgi:hypothetical protein